ncbi:MAG: hypothetical protein RIT25_1168, partial [Planctomycetota bacterium]
MSAAPAVLEELRRRARMRQARIVLPETGDARTVQARALLERDHLCQVVWADDPARHPAHTAVAAHIHQRRAHKGVDAQKARELACEPLH